MRKFDVIIIGASAAGIPAATTARKYYPNKTILMIRDVEKVPIPCGIPYIYGTVKDPEKNVIPVDAVCQKNDIEVLVSRVTKINREAKTVQTSNGETIGYDRLVIATGSKPLIPPIPGARLENVFVIEKRNAYLQGILDQLSQSKDVVVVGGGFIGVEMSEEIKKFNNDINVTIVEAQNHCLKLVYDTEFCELADEALLKQDIDLKLNTLVEEIIGDKKVAGVKLSSGETLKADLVILGIGNKANTDLALECGLEIGDTKGIKVNRYMQTTDENIFACGDCADKISFFDHAPSNLKLASIATMEARIAGANLFKTRRINTGVVGCFSTKLNGQTFAAAGLNVDKALEKGFKIVTGAAASINRHPGLMPGAEELRVKLIFEEGNQTLIGGEVFGACSGGELINAISAFISKKMTADEIATFQAGTHPALTASPIAYQLVNAAENALVKLNKE